jgi:hypothetical protein
MALVAGALMMLVTATGVVAGGDQSTGSDGTQPAPTASGAVRVSPDPTVIDLHRTAWDHVRVSADGRRLVVFFWMGVQDCYGLGKVDTVRRNGHLVIKLFTGIRPQAAYTTCIEIAQLYKTVIYLKNPILTSAIR